MECSYMVGGKQNILTKCSSAPNHITTGLKEETRNQMITRIKEKSLTPVGFEPTTSGLDHRRSTVMK